MSCRLIRACRQNEGFANDLTAPRLFVQNYLTDRHFVNTHIRYNKRLVEKYIAEVIAMLAIHGIGQMSFGRMVFGQMAKHLKVDGPAGDLRLVGG
jgi:hypothetical protein